MGGKVREGWVAQWDRDGDYVISDGWVDKLVRDGWLSWIGMVTSVSEGWVVRERTGD